MGFIFPDYQSFIVGQAAHDAINSYMFKLGLIIALLETARNLVGAKRKPSTRTLKLKKVKNVTGEFLSQGSTHSNPLFAEQNFRFFVLADKIDFAVMKLLSTDVPILAAQEHQHAKFHNMTAKVVPESQTACVQYVGKIFDTAFLRTPKWVMAGFCLLIEALSPLQMYIAAASPFSKGMFSNLYVFHGFEEVEHATVTVHYLAELCSFPARILLMVLFGLCFEVAMVIPLFMIPMTMYNKPEIIMKPRTYLIDIPCYFVHVMILEYLVLPWNVVHFMFAIPHYDFCINHIYQHFEGLMKERGFEWDVLEVKHFTLDKSLHSNPPKTFKFLELNFYLTLLKPHLVSAYNFVEQKLAEFTKALDLSFTELLDEKTQLKLKLSVADFTASLGASLGGSSPVSSSGGASPMKRPAETPSPVANAVDARPEMDLYGATPALPANSPKRRASNSGGRTRQRSRSNSSETRSRSNSVETLAVAAATFMCLELEANVSNAVV